MSTEPFDFGDDEAHPRARNTDPGTSWAAADSVTHIRRTQLLILGILTVWGPLTDEGLRRLWDHNRELPPVSLSGLRTRRKELCDLGLVADTGSKAVMSSGRRAILWRATEAGIATVTNP